MTDSSPTYKRIPVVVETLADLETPLSVYLKLADAPYSYLLESSQGGEKWGRYSIIGLPARTVLTVIGNQVTVATDGDVVEHIEDDQAFLSDIHTTVAHNGLIFVTVPAHRWSVPTVL